MMDIPMEIVMNIRRDAVDLSEELAKQFHKEQLGVHLPTQLVWYDVFRNAMGYIEESSYYVSPEYDRRWRFKVWRQWEIIAIEFPQMLSLETIEILALVYALVWIMSYEHGDMNQYIVDAIYDATSITRKINLCAVCYIREQGCFNLIGFLEWSQSILSRCDVDNITMTRYIYMNAFLFLNSEE